MARKVFYVVNKNAQKQTDILGYYSSLFRAKRALKETGCKGKVYSMELNKPYRTPKLEFETK